MGQKRKAKMAVTSGATLEVSGLLGRGGGHSSRTKEPMRRRRNVGRLLRAAAGRALEDAEKATYAAVEDWMHAGVCAAAMALHVHRAVGVIESVVATAIRED